MATSAIEAKVKSIIADQLGVGEDEIKPESSFIAISVAAIAYWA